MWNVYYSYVSFNFLQVFYKMFVSLVALLSVLGWEPRASQAVAYNYFSRPPLLVLIEINIIIISIIIFMYHATAFS